MSGWETGTFRGTCESDPGSLALRLKLEKSKSIEPELNWQPLTMMIVTSARCAADAASSVLRYGSDVAAVTVGFNSPFLCVPIKTHVGAVQRANIYPPLLISAAISL